MRTEPSNWVKQKGLVPFQVRVEKVTRIIAIIVAFLSTFTFIFKIMFF